MLRTQKGGREDRLLQKLTINRSLLSYKFITNVFQNSTLQFLRHIGICIYMGTKHVFNRKKLLGNCYRDSYRKLTDSLAIKWAELKTRGLTRVTAKKDSPVI